MKGIVPITVIVFMLFICCNETVEQEPMHIDIITTLVNDGESKTVARVGIEGMSCQVGCANMIRKTLTDLNGVITADVQFEPKLAIVEYDNAVLSENELVRAINELMDGQYSVTGLEIEKHVTDEKQGSSSNQPVSGGNNPEGEEETVEHIPPTTITFPDIFDAITRLYPY